MGFECIFADGAGRRHKYRDRIGIPARIYMRVGFVPSRYYTRKVPALCGIFLVTAHETFDILKRILCECWADATGCLHAAANLLPIFKVGNPSKFKRKIRC